MRQAVLLYQTTALSDVAKAAVAKYVSATSTKDINPNIFLVGKNHSGICSEPDATTILNNSTK